MEGGVAGGGLGWARARGGGVQALRFRAGSADNEQHVGILDDLKVASIILQCSSESRNIVLLTFLYRQAL